MKRDLDLLRALLLFIEDKDEGTGATLSPKIFDNFYDKYEQSIVFGHLKLLEEAMLIEATLKTHGSFSGKYTVTMNVNRLTNHGHDYLDMIRNNDAWEFTKTTAVKAGGWTLSLLGDIAKSYINAKLVEYGALPPGG